MRELFRFSKILVTDVLGVLCLIGAVLTGWLPGPGGIPLFILGLSLLAIHHPWARRYITLARNYADKIGDYVFLNNPKVQFLYDLLAPVLLIGAVYLFWQSNALWQVPLSSAMLFVGLALALGNRQRWPKVKAILKRDITPDKH